MPEEIIQKELHKRAWKDRDKQTFFQPLANAWDAIAFDRYEPDSLAFQSACHVLSGNLGRIDSPIKLSDPLQVKIIDALAEITHIPHQRGQTEIEIPEKLRGLRKPGEWIAPHEFIGRLNKTQKP